MTRLAAILITFWAGSLWTVCGLVAPTLFAVLDDRHLAGQLAARFFLLETWIGVVIAALLIALNLMGKLILPGRWLVIVAALLPLASHLILSPFMDQARAAGNMARFGLLHGLASICFFGACAAMLAVIWKFNRPAG